MNLFYRNRLVRAYLGASHSARHPNPFTGLDPDDDLLLQDFRADRCYSGPFPVVNSALNLVSGKDLAWQERKAESFVFTPLRCGFDTWLEQIDLKNEQGTSRSSPSLNQYGYRPTEHYGFRDRGLRLGTVVSIGVVPRAITLRLGLFCAAKGVAPRPVAAKTGHPKPAKGQFQFSFFL